MLGLEARRTLDLSVDNHAVLIGCLHIREDIGNLILGIAKMAQSVADHRIRDGHEPAARKLLVGHVAEERLD